MTSIRHNLLRPSLDWLLIFLPVTDVDRHPDNEVIPGVLAFRVEALLLNPISITSICSLHNSK